ncbi:cytochrome P450 [Coniochaeta ligniaria NRRL 30616]|uniref:Cytochrome P450 n=1 Tax=Coniochaeta ligniaria NRRL 30616 TaxID=1408157 RepID=A0A1J7JPR3_9PEZI|nr:cytochrome P450 [Coniochaeta ligniaria NRRL 30616]
MLFYIALASIFTAAVLYPIVAYFKDEKGLRKYPAPSIAAFTPLWQMYHNWKGLKFLAVDRVHRELGDVVRLGPNHVSFSSPRSFRDIYGHGTSIIKDTFYDNQAGGNPNMADATNKATHREKRKNLAFVFSPKQITATEPRVMRIVEKLVRDIKIKAQGGMVSDTDRFPVKDGVFDLRPWLNMFSYDAITDIFWSQSYGFLDRGNDDCMAEAADGTLRKVSAMHTFHTNTGFSVLVGHLSPFWFDLVKNKLLAWTFASKSGPYFTGMARHLATQRLRNPPKEPDLFSNLPTHSSEKRPVPMSRDEILAESSVMLNAGNDTTQSALTNTMYDLALNASKQHRLRDELRRHLDTDQLPIASYEALQHVPYLRAVIDESFRLHPPLGTGVPRLTTEPTVIDGKLIPPGVTVSAQAWSLHRREDLFRDAESWIPERWLPDGDDFSDEERRNLKDYVQPFSQGPRACIGRNLAYMELSICIAALVLAFEWTLPHQGAKLRHHERFNCNPVELPIRARALL